MIIMAFIGVNMLTMTLDHYDQNRMWSFALDNLNMGFIVVFTTECILKIFALRQYYFKEPWNVFDFIVVILSILGMYGKKQSIMNRGMRDFSYEVFFSDWGKRPEHR